MKNQFILLCALIFTLSCVNENSENVQSSDSDVYDKLSELGIELVEPGPPSNNFVYAVRSGNIIYLAGHGPLRPGSGYMTGKVGGEDGLTVEEGQEAARLTGISLLSSLHQEIGDLNNVSRIVKVHGMVNADPFFTQHSQVMNGFSDLMVEVFGEKGRHARAAVGMGSLPMNIPVEIEMVVEVQE